ncbi:MAG: 16S rRNA (cytidine(1402)-2'-O)-methyltransferase [Gammaproteobacteria bacterium]|nr:16S rRNA (cytidine(1402)-2'-O)-methyltransferase [Gammaproteobacteria bacterium]
MYIVATPIGNIEDISSRALSVLSSVDYIFAEDTRRTAKLLHQYSIKAPMQSLHDHNESDRIDDVIALLESGNNLALVSDAGTPLISDPGYKLVKALHQHNLKVVPIPGASALISALSVAGIATDKFSFEGFLPAKLHARQSVLNDYKSGLLGDRTLVFYESTHRIISSLTDMLEILGEEQEITIARELTKTYETLYVGTLKDVFTIISSDSNHQKGEFVIVLSGKSYVTDSNADKNDISVQSRELLIKLLTELTVKQAVSLAVKITGEKKKKLYSAALKIDSNKGFE